MTHQFKQLLYYDQQKHSMSFVLKKTHEFSLQRWNTHLSFIISFTSPELEQHPRTVKHLKVGVPTLVS